MPWLLFSRCQTSRWLVFLPLVVLQTRAENLSLTPQTSTLAVLNTDVRRLSIVFSLVKKEGLAFLFFSLVDVTGTLYSVRFFQQCCTYESFHIPVGGRRYWRRVVRLAREETKVYLKGEKVKKREPKYNAGACLLCWAFGDLTVNHLNRWRKWSRKLADYSLPLYAL